MPPMPIQRRLPLITGAKNNTNSNASASPAMADQMTNGC